MPGKLRPYQKKAVIASLKAWNDGTKNLVLVSPTGSGKTKMAEAIIEKALKRVSVTVVCHTSALKAQLQNRLPSCSVTTIQSQGFFPAEDYGLLVLDECHHYVAEEWGKVGSWPGRILGMTATPERADGKPLGNLFDRMIVAADYPGLIAGGYISDLDIIHPVERQDPGEISMCPVDAYLKYASGKNAIVFCDTIAACMRYHKKLSSKGVSCATVTSEDSNQARVYAIEAHRQGMVKVLFNVYTLTEGFDAPDTSVCILARNCGHHSTYLQIVGRVLRGRERALLIDLCGSSLVFGGLSELRLYSLERGMELASRVTARDCPQCGYTAERFRACPKCGWRPDQRAKTVKITNAELKRNYQGDMTSDLYKGKELDRLVSRCLSRGWSLYWAANQYRKLFKEWPVVDVPEPLRRTEFRKLLASSKSRKQASVKYKQIFGEWPR